MAEIAIAAAVAAAVSAAAYTVSYALTPKAKPIERGKRSGDIQIQDSRYGHMIPILLGGPPVEEPTNDRSLWLKADDADFSALADDDPITQWTNRAALTLGLDFEMESGSPAYHPAGGANDQPYVSFAAGDNLSGHPADNYMGVDAYTLFFVLRPQGAGDASPTINFGKRFASDGGNYWAFMAQGEKFAEYRDRSGGPTVYDSNYTQDQWYLVELSFDGSEVSLWVNGGTPVTASASNILTLANNLLIGCYFGGISRPCIPFDLAEVIGYKANISPTTRNAERDYLASKYDLPVTTSPVVLPPTSGGGMRVAGNVIWMSDVRKVETTTPAEGGKFGNKNPDTVTTSYYCDLGIMFGEGELDLIQLYAGTDLILDRSATSSTGARDATVDPDPDEDNNFLHDPTDLILRHLPAQRFGGVIAEDSNGTVTGTLVAGNHADFRFYSGSETQLPDPLIEADLGVGSTPAYLGRSYIVLENFEVGKYGFIPNFTAILSNKNLKTATDCIDHLCQRVGFDPSEFDVSNVAQFHIRGIPIFNREAPRNTVELIGKIFAFDFVETDGQMVCVLRGGEPTFEITEEDLGAIEVDGTEDPQAADIPELISNSLELDQTVLPRRVDVNFYDPARNGENNTAGVSRMEALANGFITEEINAVLSYSEARQLAQRIMDTAWIESAGAIKAQVAHTFAGDITAAAVGTISANDITHTVRVKQVNGFVPGVLEVVGVKTRAATYAQTNITPGGDAGAPTDTPTTPAIPATTVVTFIDRLLRDREIQDGRTGFYVAACSFGNGSWGSANVYCDRGSGYVHLINVPEQATMGVVDDTDATIAGGSTVDVVLYAEQTLPAGPAYVMQGELIYQYSTATQLSTSPNLWQLSGLSDIGARCTTAENGSHVVGERLVLLNQALRFVAVEESEIGVARNYKVPTAGADLEDTGVIEFTIDAPNVAITTPSDWTMTAGNGEIIHSFTPFSDECVLAAGLIYEVHEDSAGSPGALIFSGNTSPIKETGLSAGIYTRHFRARTAFSDGDYLMASITVTASSGAAADLDRILIDPEALLVMIDPTTLNVLTES